MASDFNKEVYRRLCEHNPKKKWQYYLIWIVPQWAFSLFGLIIGLILAQIIIRSL